MPESDTHCQSGSYGIIEFYKHISKRISEWNCAHLHALVNSVVPLEFPFMELEFSNYYPIAIIELSTSWHGQVDHLVFRKSNPTCRHILMLADLG